MAALATQTIRRSGVKPVLTAAAGGGDSFTPGPNAFFHAKNGSGAPIDVTFNAVSAPESDMVTTNLKVTVPAGEERLVGPIDYPTFSNPANAGAAGVTYSGVTSLTVGVFDITQP